MTPTPFLSPAVLGLALLIGGAAQAAVVGALATRTPDNQIAITWTVVSGAAVNVLVSTDPAASPGAMQIVSIRDYDGEHFAPAQKSRSYFLIQDSGGGDLKVAERVVPLAGAVNFRDIGGYPTADGQHVRWGMIYRSSELANLTAEDYDGLNRLGIRTIYDLRSVEERSDKPTVWQGAAPPEILAHDYAMDTSPLTGAFRDGASVEKARSVMTSYYAMMIDSHRTQFRTVFAELLEGENGAILYHCSDGKDRTGVQTALILAALGVTRDVILADFELSNAHSRPNMTVAVLTNPQTPLAPDVNAVLMSADKAYLQAFFDAIDRGYGGVDGYLAELGVGAAERRTLRARYTE
jgi:protein-tyrosine phosphatase